MSEQAKQLTLPLIDGIPDLWVMLKLEHPMSPREFRFLQHALSAKMQEWLKELAPGQGTLAFYPGYETVAQSNDYLVGKLDEVKAVLAQKEKPESLRIVDIVQDMLREDAADIRKRFAEGLKNLEPPLGPQEGEKTDA